MIFLMYLCILIHPLICVFIDITSWTIASTPGHVSATMKVNPVNRFVRLSTDHQSLLINGVSKAVTSMLTAGGLHNQATFNIASFTFDKVRYEYDYVGISMNYIYPLH